MSDFVYLQSHKFLDMKAVSTYLILLLCFQTNLKAQESNENGVAVNSKKDPELWMSLEENSQFLEAASYLLYKVQSDSTRNKHADYWHIGRMYGYLNDYEKAIFYLSKSTENINPNDDEQWWWYFYGTITFLERDKEALLKYMTKLNIGHTQYYEPNAKTLVSLYKNFEKGYREASLWK